MTMTVLGPLPTHPDVLDVVRDWRIDSLIEVLGQEKEVVDAALARLDYNRDLRPQLFVPASLGEVPLAFTGPHRTYVCVNQKGGAGKTTTSVELAAAWIAMGYTVRIIDADTQDASLSTEWILPNYDGIAEHERYSLEDVLFGRQPLDEATYETSIKGLYIVPSGARLGAVEYDPAGARDGSLRKAIRQSKAEVDITIIDAPPALGKLSVNGLIAADQVIVPLKVGSLDKAALRKLAETIRAVQEDANPDLRVAAGVMTGYDRSNYAGVVAATLRRDFPEAIVAAARRNVRVAAAAEDHLPVRVTDPKGTTTSDYDQLARLLLPVKGAIR